ncbi:CheR family methyltransferase [Pararoseomonas indoligenes]|uniref:PAS domain-containing protein n=1 Tax=Roseomonas indoligenes TaxID=2820811 RepID=A0A940N234_9PROT|nr:CheR family methyltransferase [Pararoseomonas indoligenes]MBP0495347.1 PAS domain-containing protein [Pararoseomonas indoligenes]
MRDQDAGADTPDGAAPVAVVGLGVSAATFQALVRLFSIMPRESGAAFVIVSESREAIDTAALIRALNENGGPAAGLAADGDRLVADRILVAPVGTMTTLEDGRLRIAPAEERPGHRGTVDSFLISLAEAEREAAVTILLESMPAAGSIGVARLKACGGLILAEGEETEGPALELQGAAAMADLHLPLAEIPRRLLALVAHLREVDGPREARAVLQDGESYLPAIATILRNRTGHDFHGYKANTFLRRIQRRMHVLRIEALDDYVARLRGSEEEAQNLFEDLLIGVTQFFRDPAEFTVLEERIIPAMLEGRGGADTVRVWVLGCATGEEAYSLAMLLREAMAGMDAPPHVQIFATDIDARALTVARTGRYPQAIEKDVPPERLARWFVKEGGTYAIHKDLREMCIFSAHNVIKDAPFSRTDLISCRNLLIYLNSELQERVIPLFHFSLRPGGYLFLGPSENVTRHGKLFQPVDRKHRIFCRQETATRVLPEFPLTARAETRRAEMGQPARPLAGSSLGRRAERVVERHAPAYVVVDPDYQVLNFSGRTGPFLDPSSGVANLNLLNLVNRDLRLDLRAALMRAAAERRAVRIASIRMGLEDEARRVGMTVEPLADNPQDPLHFVVLFHDHGLDGGESEEEVRDPAVLRDEHVLRLEGELRVTKDRLQATIEELESTNEELKSSNEEYQSINEELQSANEELETSKEELQSVNEELQTVNGELGHRVSELARANSDLKNLLESTQIATLFLDNDMRVKSFTPSMSEVFHLMDGDLGRPIAHLASRVPYPEMGDDLRHVMRTLSTTERQIGLPEGRRYLVRVLPYRSVDNFIAGAVLTFLDVTAAVRAQEALRAAEARVRLATAAARIITWDLDSESGRFTYSEGFEALFGAPPPATLPSLLGITHPEDRGHLALAFDRTLARGEPLDVEGRLLAGRTELWIRFSGGRSGGQVLGVFQDVDARRRAEAQRSLLMAELQHRVKNIMAVVRSITRRSLENAESLDDLRLHLGGRIDSLARTQGLLANRGEEGMSLDALVRDELAAVLGQDGGRVEIEGPPILLKDKAAETFALGIHELATNAVKYGALSGPEGRLNVRWHIRHTAAGDRLALEWREAGVPVLDVRPTRTGFGRGLIERGLPYDLGAATSLEFLPGGVRCTVELPMGPRVVALDGEEELEESGDDDGA